MIWLLACAAPPPAELSLRWVGDGIEVHSTAPLSSVLVLDALDKPLLRRDLAVPGTELYVTVDARPGTLHVQAQGPNGPVAGEVTVPVSSPWVAEVQPAPGAGWVPAQGRVEVPLWGDRASIFLRVTAGPSAIDVATDLGVAHLPAPGSRALLPVELDRSRTVHIGGDTVELALVPRDPARVKADLQLGGAVFPATADGDRDLGRPSDAVVLPSPLWESLLAAAGWGTRMRAAEEPWTNVTVPVENQGSVPLDLVVSAWFSAADGGPAPAFLPRLRAADGGTDRVVALLRVPPGTTGRAVLPVFVDVRTVSAGPYTLHTEVTPLGAPAVLAASDQTVVVRRGDSVVSIGFLLALLTSVIGLSWTARTLPVWLRRASTTDLMVNALFGTALFVVSSATDVLAMTIGAMLGPFSSLFSGLLYDAGRTVLLATLLQLQPRSGTIALSILCSWLGRGVLLGSIGLPDLIYTGVAVALGEGFAWWAGLTRGKPLGRLRLSLAFGCSNALLTLCGLWLHMVLYRLSFAGWYIAMQVAFPGFVYVVLACQLAVPFARSLREVDA
jgi:hypothetical protein